MKFEVSWFVVLWKRIWGGKEAVFDYFLGKVNNIVAVIPDATKDRLQEIIESLKKFLECVESLGWLVPEKWKPYYDAIIACIKKILEILEDAEITPEEIKEVVSEFQSAYAVWHTED